MTVINRDEWLKAMAEAIRPCDPAALTLVELAKLLNIDRSAAYRQIRKLVAQGRAVPMFKMVATSGGFLKRTPAYKLVTDAPRVAARRR